MRGFFDHEEGEMDGSCSRDRAARDRLRETNERVHESVTWATFLLIAAGVVVLYLLPRFSVHRVRRVGGGVFLGFGGWLEGASHRDWRDVDEAIEYDLPLPARRMPGRAYLGPVTSGLVATLLLLVGRRL